MDAKANEEAFWLWPGFQWKYTHIKEGILHPENYLNQHRIRCILHCLGFTNKGEQLQLTELFCQQNPTNKNKCAEQKTNQRKENDEVERRMRTKKEFMKNLNFPIFWSVLLLL